MLIKTSEKMTAAAQLRRFLEHYTPAEANTADEFTRLGKARATVEMPTKSLRLEMAITPEQNTQIQILASR